MKILYLQCGLGNQMFQFAYLRYLQSVGVSGLVIDTSAPSLHTHNEVVLRDVFPNIASAVKFLPYWRGRTLHLYSDLLKKGLGIDLETTADGGVFPKGKKWLRGYFQVAYPAERCREQLLRDFTFPDFTDEINSDLACRIGGVESVAVHIRRGDYVSCNAASAQFGACASPEYYARAIGHMEANLSSPHYFIFSDDAQWVQSEFLTTHSRIASRATIVKHNSGSNSYRDMQLMSLCRHAVLANSSFSWWGAFLAQYSPRIVVAPARWFGNATAQFNAEICPANWVRL